MDDNITLTREDFVITGADERRSERHVRPAVNYWSDAWRRLRKNPSAMGALALIVLIVILAIIGPYLRGYDFVTMAPQYRNRPPDARFWFGADNLGRDLFSRVWYSARVSLLISLVCTLIQMIVGSIYGGIMAYRGGMLDNIMMKLIVVLTSMPSLLIIILVMIVLGNNITGMMAALCVSAWCETARQVRGQLLQLKNLEYVTASRALGGRSFWMIRKHLLPNTIGVLILNAAVSAPGYIFMESTLSFLGIGLQAPHISLGTLIAAGQQTMDFHPYQLFFPAAVLCLTVLAVNLFGDGLRDALDPRLRV